MYQMKNFGTEKKFIFIPNSMDIYDMQTNSKVATDEVNHQSRLYTFFEFIEPDSALLLTHADESSRIWHERFGHLNFRYMQQLRKKILVDGLPTSISPREYVRDVFLENTLKRNSTKEGLREIPHL
jgi:hypothetical protein